MNDKAHDIQFQMAILMTEKLDFGMSPSNLRVIS
jgi:hypothetical protein